MKQVNSFCEENIIFCTMTLTIRERLKLLLKGSLRAEIDQNNSGSAGSVKVCYLPKIFRERGRGDG